MSEEKMCRTPEEIANDNLIITEVDDFIDANNIEPVQKLILRVVRRNFIATEQIKDDQIPVLKYIKESRKSPSFITLFKDKPMKTTGMIFTMVAACYLVLEILNHALGFESIIKLLVP